MIRTFFVKILIKILLLAIIPIILITQFSITGIIATIAYFQFLLIWAQAEIGLKQHVLFSAQFDPSFELKLVRFSPESYQLTIQNTSKNTAYNVRIVRVITKLDSPINPTEWEKKLSYIHSKNLVPGEQSILGVIKDISYFNDKAIEILYSNQFGDFKELHVLIVNTEIWVIPPSLQEPGILLNTFRQINLFYEMMRYGMMRKKRLK